MTRALVPPIPYRDLSETEHTLHEWREDNAESVAQLAAHAYAHAERVDDDEDEGRTYYLGTVFSRYPSGKYYTPFARSNVEPCPACGDKPPTPRVGEGPMDIWRTYEGYKHSLDFGKRVVEWHGDHVEPHPAILTAPACPYCDGLGSMEAAQDEEWQSIMDAELSKFGGYMGSGEGDPCDLFAYFH